MEILKVLLIFVPAFMVVLLRGVYFRRMYKQKLLTPKRFATAFSIFWGLLLSTFLLTVFLVTPQLGDNFLLVCFIVVGTNVVLSFPLAFLFEKYVPWSMSRRQLRDGYPSE